ncbi:MAG TPA: mechanosensitive ion channel domain-containing protein [Patescibacteria group bacterium]|nr:mechanosensitive ion channel domain-containing protein [Patescibacteria group bacterium]
MQWDMPETSQLMKVALVALAGLALMGALAVIRHRLLHKDLSYAKFGRRIYTELKTPAILLVALGCLVALTKFFDFDWLDEDVVRSVSTMCFIWLAAWAAIRGVNLLSYVVLRRRRAVDQTTLEARMVITQVRVLKRLAIAVITIVGISAALMTFDAVRALGTSLLASAGLAGVVLGLAAQKTMGNFFTGLQIAVTQPIRIGDSIIVENDFATIEEINLTYVVAKTWDLRRLILPINYFVEKPFQNWSRQTQDLLTQVFLWVDYMMPLEPIRAELDRLLKATPLWNGKVKTVAVTDTNDKAMQIRLLASADNSGANSDLQQYLRENMIVFIRDNYPQFLAHTRSTSETVVTREMEVPADRDAQEAPRPQ